MRVVCVALTIFLSLCHMLITYIFMSSFAECVQNMLYYVDVCVFAIFTDFKYCCFPDYCEYADNTVDVRGVVVAAGSLPRDGAYRQRYALCVTHAARETCAAVRQSSPIRDTEIACEIVASQRKYAVRTERKLCASRCALPAE